MSSTLALTRHGLHVQTTTVDDVDAAIQSSHKAFKEYSITNPRVRAQTLLKWHELITAAQDDLAKILTYETGKPLAEAYGELTYSLGFTWWFAGEAERIQGSISVPSAPSQTDFRYQAANRCCRCFGTMEFPHRHDPSQSRCCPGCWMHNGCEAIA